MEKSNVLEAPQIEYWNPNELLSYDRYLYMVLGGRNIGKTYATKVMCVKRFIKYGEQFLYVRRHESNFKKGTLTNFFDKIQKEFPEHKLEVKRGVFYCDGKVCGTAVPLSKWQVMKGSEFPDIYTIFMDEFLKEKDATHYIGNEPQTLMSLAETVFRDKIMNNEKVRIICLSNMTTIANPYFLFFKVFPTINKRFNTFKHAPELVIEIVNQDSVQEAKRNSRFYNLIEGTSYEDVSMKSEFVYDNEDFIAKRSKNAKFKFMVSDKNMSIGIWVDMEQRLMYASKSVDVGTKYRYVFERDVFDEHNQYIRNYRDNMHIDKLVQAFKNGQLRFENAIIKNAMFDMFSKLRIK